MKQPTLEEVLTFATENNIQETSARKFFFHYDAIGWQDALKRPIINWRSKLSGWSTEDQLRQARQRQAGVPTQVPRPATTQEAQRKRLKEMYDKGGRFYVHQIEAMIQHGIATGADFDSQGYKI